MTIYKDFVGLNYCIYDPCGIDHGLFGFEEGGQLNSLGYSFPPKPGFNSTAGNFEYWYTSSVGSGYVTKMTSPNPANVLVLLNLHRNGNWGYGSWKQIRTSHNHLTRFQRRNNIFTYIEEPGQKYQITINNKQYDHLDRFGKLYKVTEPVVVDSYKPLEVVGGMSIYNPKTNQNEIRSVSIKTTFSNETVFFANDKVNQYYDTIVESDESYEDLKALYLQGGLEDASSPIERFNMFIYKQTVFPKMQYAFLDKTRSRKSFECSFWKSTRSGRTDAIGLRKSNGFGGVPRYQSLWPLDARTDTGIYGGAVGFETFGPPGQQLSFPLITYQYMLGGEPAPVAPRLGLTFLYKQFGSRGGAGALQNNYSQLYRGFFSSSTAAEFISSDNPFLIGAGYANAPELQLSASVQYAKKHTLKNIHSFVSETGMYIAELKGAPVQSIMIHTKSLFLGEAAWDAGKQAGKNPFYDSYADYNQNIRLKGQGYSIIPEFRISSHVEEYQTLGVTEELKSIFELSGAVTQDTTTENYKDFYTVLSNTDFLKHFDLIKEDHKDFVNPAAITLKCKAVKKFLPYDGFYPVQRTVQIAKVFYETYKDYIQYSTEDGLTTSGSFGIQSLLEPLYAPGILYNTIKSGVAVDYPVISDPLAVGGVNVNEVGFQVSSEKTKSGQPLNFVTEQLQNVLLTGSYPETSSHGAGSRRNYGSLTSIFDKRIPFEALINPGQHLANRSLVNQDPHPWSGGDKSKVAIWSGKGGKKYSNMMSQFLAEIPEFFLKDKNFKTITSLESQDTSFGNAIAGNYYAMRIKMYRTKNRPNETMPGYGSTQVVPPQDLYGASRKSGKEEYFMRENFTMYSRTSGFGPPLYGGGSGSYQNYNITSSAFGRFDISGSDSLWGYNWAYTPPYYHGDAWCDLIFECTESKKYTVDEIVSAVKSFPYYTRYWWNGHQQAMRDLTGYQHDEADTVTSGFSGSFNSLAYIRTGDPTYPLATNGSAMNSLIEGPHKSYYNGPWHNLIKTGRFTYTGMLLPMLVGYAGGMAGNYGFPYETFRTTGDAWQNMHYGNFGSRWLLDGWSSTLNSSHYTFGGWLGPPYHTQLDQTMGSPPYHPYYLNSNAMQLDASINLFSIGSVRKRNLEGTNEVIEVATEETSKAKSRWIIQTKFETPMLNFNKYTDLKKTNCTSPAYASESVPRGMWHQYGEVPPDNKGVFLQVEDLPGNWMRGALGLNWFHQKKVLSLADLVGMPTKAVKLGELPQVNQISECVVAVPFFEEKGERRFFTIPREEIEDVKSALKREVEPGVFVLGGPPKTGNTIIQMVKKMKKYVFPPSMDFIKYPEIEPFAMYIFEFLHNLDKNDIADIWQNLPPKIGRSFQTSEVSLSHELLAHELLGGGAQIVNDKLNENATGREIRSDIQWMLFKVKKKAKTNYFDKIVDKKGSTADTTNIGLEGISESELGENPDITYNWPYDYFSLVELVKLDAEITFADLENDDKGNKVIKEKEKLDPALEAIRKRMAKDVAKAMGNQEKDQ